MAARWQPFDHEPAEPRYPGSSTEAVRDCIDQALHAVAAALLTDDPTVLSDTRGWVAAVLAARGDGQADRHAAELGTVLGGLLREYPLTSALLEMTWSAPADGT